MKKCSLLNITLLFRIPLRELHEKNVIQRSIPNVEQLRKIIRKERMHVDTVHTLCVSAIYIYILLYIFLRLLPVAVTGSPNLLCCILRYFSDFAFCCCVI